jgi:P27 family predicted phage terminase small subunit
MRGRKPTPTKLRILRGNASKKPLNPREPKPKRHVPTCPEHLDDVAKAEWQRKTQELDAVGMLTDLDGVMLAVWCVAYSDWVSARQMLSKFGGTMLKGDNSVYQNPYLHVASKAVEQMLKVGPLFGLDPSSRQRLHAQPATTEQDDLAAFIG